MNFTCKPKETGWDTRWTRHCRGKGQRAEGREQGARSMEKGARSKEQGAWRREKGEGRKGSEQSVPELGDGRRATRNQNR